MSNVIVFTNDLGGVTVCYPTGELSIEEVQSKDIPSGVKSHIVDIDSLPKNADDFFDAWEQSSGIVVINIEKAKQITRNRLRIQREPLLVAQDVAFQRALEENLDTTSIIEEKNRLRNITKLVDPCFSIDQLRLITVY